MLTKILLGGAGALAFASAAFAQGPGSAQSDALAGYQAMATSSPLDIGEFARSAKGQTINDRPDYASIAFSQHKTRGTGYALPVVPPPEAGSRIAPAPVGQ